MSTRVAAGKSAAPAPAPARADRPDQGLAHGICEALQKLIYGGEIARASA